MTPDHEPVSGIVVTFVCLCLLIALIFCGCASTSAIKTCANGDRWEIRSNRLLWQTEHVTVKAPDGTTVDVSNTKPDNEAITASAGAIGAIAGAAVKAAAKP